MNKQPVTQADKNREKLKDKREQQLGKKELQLNKLTDEEVISELKNKGLPTFGTKPERLDRLKKFHGITPTIDPTYAQPEPTKNTTPTQDKPNPNPPKKAAPKSSVVDEVEKLKQKREERRLKLEEVKREKAEREAENEALGRAGDVEFDLMIEKNRIKQHLLQPHVAASELKLCVCVRKRPIFKKEETVGEIDAVSSANPQIVVHECKFKVDGITKYVENNGFTFDNTFNEKETNDDIYKYTIQPLVDFILNQGIVTCFAYGQTGSGKTFTMKGVQDSAIRDLFKLNETKYRNLGLNICASFFEIYGGRCYDLLNSHNKLAILEDKNQNVQIQGLCERNVATMEEMLQLIEFGNSVRTTHQTVANDTSSRSHAICQILLRDSNEKVQGKLLLVDLAGSERAQDTQSNNRARRIEGAEINKSLLALKECIRAMDSNKQGSGGNHVPFRASKLTLVLRDSFIAKNNKSRIVMIACISPGSSSADHSLNTLRYADRLKEKSNAYKPIKYDPANFLTEEVQEEAKVEPERQPQKPVMQEPSVRKPTEANGNLSDRGNAAKPNKPPVSQNKGVAENRGNVEQANQKNPVRGAAFGGAAKGGKAANARDGEKPLTIDQIPEKDMDLDKSMSSEDEREEEVSPGKKSAKKANEDLEYMKKTMRKEENKNLGNEYFDFQEKINYILEEQEEIFSLHMSAIKEDARLLTAESELISNVQGIGVVDYDIDSYVQRLEGVIKTKLQMYSLLDKKLAKFKKHLKEEEEASTKIKDTFYY